MTDKTKYTFIRDKNDNGTFEVGGELVQVAALDKDGNIITFIYAHAEQAEYAARRLSYTVDNVTFAVLHDGVPECKFLNSKQITAKE